MSSTKLITCCYCGARDVMRVAKGERRTLTCLTCGAPMRKMEVVKSGAELPPRAATPDRINKHRKQGWHEAAHKKKKKRRKGVFAKLFDEAEDLFDIGDILDFD